jgi:hypothetical protein
MSLTIYPTTDADSFISLADADIVITNNSIQSATWLALSEAEREVYLRIATTRIFNVVSTDTSNEDGYLDSSTYVASESCLPKATALMAVHDLVYGLSSEINPNTGLVSKEKVGDIEVNYFHGYIDKQANGRKTNPYPGSIIPCLNYYGANIQLSKLRQATLVRG